MDDPPSPPPLSGNAHAPSWSIRLAARNNARGIDRVYGLTLGVDLFGVVTLDVFWGRAGTAGRVMRLAFANEAEALAEARRRLARRATAKRRIGAAYVAAG
jgi:predicted DNA-binding WGR domain protein